MHYIDTSALAKLVVQERESRAFKRWFHSEGSSVVTSDLTRTELVRAVRRYDSELVVAAQAMLDAIVVVKVPRERFDEAARLTPVTLRTLDAIHLACAQALGNDLTSIATYDERLAEAARHVGIPVIAPA